MKVMQIIPNFDLAGAETMCATLSKELVKRNVDVVVVSLYDSSTYLTDDIKNNNIPLYCLNKKAGMDLKIINRLREVIVKEKPDVIHTHLYSLKYAYFASVGYNIRFIHTIHNVAKLEVSNVDRMLHGFLFKYGGVIPISLSEEIQQSVCECYNLDKSSVPIIYNGVDLTKCIKKVDYTINGNVKLINVARFSSQKNHIELLLAFKKSLQTNKNLELLLVGDGDLYDLICNKIKELELSDKVTVFGKTNNVFPLLNKSDIFVLPSLYEGVPITIIEAMGTAIPVIASNVGGVPNMIDNNYTGLLCTPNCDSICDAILNLASDIELRERLGVNARLVAKVRFSAEEMSKKYKEIYESI